MNKTILELNSITFRYDEKTFYFQNKCKNNVNDDKEMAAILDDVSLAVCQSEIYGLLGASGCGKTTLLRLILGQLSPSSGSIQVFGQEIDPNEQSPSHLCNIGYMPQDIVLYNEFSTFEMLQYFGRLYRMPNNECMKRIDQLLKLLELDVGTGGDVGHHHDCSHRNQLIKHLSGGQRRRVSLAIALLHDPRLLILDEPTVGVDPLLRESLITLKRHVMQIKLASYVVDGYLYKIILAVYFDDSVWIRWKLHSSNYVIIMMINSSYLSLDHLQSSVPMSWLIMVRMMMIKRWPKKVNQS